MPLNDHLAELQHILDQQLLTPLFQPILSLTSGELVGYEALIRGPSDSPLHSPLVLFKSAMTFGLLERLEMLCRKISISAFAAAKVEGLLFLNVNPLLLLTSDHPTGLTKQLIQQSGLDPSRVVIELSEQYQVDDANLLLTAVCHYRDLGFLIAIDDLGSGFSGLKLWSELKPEIVKIDRYFIDEVHKDPTKKAFVKNIIALAKATGSKVVAEGIETSEELLLCRELGADLGQGYLLGRPAAGFLKHPQHHVLLSQANNSVSYADSILPLVIDQIAVSAKIPTGQVFEIFQKKPELHCLAVLEGEKPIGLISKVALYEKFSHPYGRSLFEKKPVRDAMDANPIIVDEQTSLDEVSQLVSASADDDQSWFFIVTRQGNYQGVSSIRQLFKRVSDNKVQLARYANPLTMLPGNVPIYRHIDQLLLGTQPFAVAYLDLNHFKPYNDFYGYSKGDLVIQLLADIIQQEVNSHVDFVGHIGGDDFIIVFPDDDAAACCQRIITQFQQRIVFYYEPQHVADKGFHAHDRSGGSHFYPLLTLAIGLVSPDPQQCRSHHDVSALVTAAKQQAKKIAEGGVFISRRRQPLLVAQA
ncbi:MAG: GGDEF domain-containing protein [Gammaproteobacteria bacterium]|nr:GGDEF domain-containing protein [Gammaproteobacteria bacterium]